MTPLNIKTSYLESVFVPHNLKLTVNKTVKIAEQLRAQHDFYTIVFTGVSGAAMAFIMGHWLDMPLLCVRKLSENSHFNRVYATTRLEGNLNTRRYMFVDDFISSGTTANYVIDTIKKELPLAECVCLLMYGQAGSSVFQHASWPEQMAIVSSRPENTVSPFGR